MSTTKSAAGSPVFVKMLHWMLVVVAFSLPLPGRLPVPVISALILLWLAEIVCSAIRTRSFGFLAIRLRDHGSVWVLLALLLPILAYVAGIFWSSDAGSSRFEMEKKSMMLLFPLLMFSLPSKVVSASLKKHVLVAFLVSLCAIAIWKLSMAMIVWLHSGDSSVLYYSKLVAPYHPSYLSMYTCFAIAATSVFLMKAGNTWKSLILLALLLLFWIVFTVLLSSRAGILMLCMVLILILIRWIGKVSPRIWIPAILVLVVTGALLFNLSGSPVKTRMGAILNIRLSEDKMNELSRPDGVVVRVLGWKVAMEQIAEKPWLGSGTGDYHHETRLKLEQHHLIEPFGGFRNSHNQYLQTTATLGVLGLVALLLFLFFPPLWLGRERSWLYGVFVIIIAFNLAVESMLEVQAGILFITFFHVLLYRTSQPKEHLTEASDMIKA
jgi:O-antigen ligase